MTMPINALKRALARGEPQIGLWLALADNYTAEIAATAGFGWLLIDGEHAPNDVRSILGQLQTLAAYPSHVVVRPVDAHVAVIKQLLDVGAQSLLVPMIETAEQARSVVAATRYPPAGMRGVGSAIARASRWNQHAAYLREADDQICLLLQVESQRGIDNLDAIAAVEGVDGVFFGPADLSASMGHRGTSGASEVQDAIETGIARVRAAGKAPGILAFDAKLARRYLELGALFVAVGADVGSGLVNQYPDVSLLARATRELAASFKNR
ncbi:MAG: 4-hydroxy-2-oxoheptanedioate aldolase [Burkholderiaceae bacterium]